jgi:hypothetical protein
MLDLTGAFKPDTAEAEEATGFDAQDASPSWLTRDWEIGLDSDVRANPAAIPKTPAAARLPEGAWLLGHEGQADVHAARAEAPQLPAEASGTLEHPRVSDDSIAALGTAASLRPRAPRRRSTAEAVRPRAPSASALRRSYAQPPAPAGAPARGAGTATAAAPASQRATVPSVLGAGAHTTSVSGQSPHKTAVEKALSGYSDATSVRGSAGGTLRSTGLGQVATERNSDRGHSAAGSSRGASARHAPLASGQRSAAGAYPATGGAAAAQRQPPSGSASYVAKATSPSQAELELKLADLNRDYESLAGHRRSDGAAAAESAATSPIAGLVQQRGAAGRQAVSAQARAGALEPQPRSWTGDESGQGDEPVQNGSNGSQSSLEAAAEEVALASKGSQHGVSSGAAVASERGSGGDQFLMSRPSAVPIPTPGFPAKLAPLDNELFGETPRMPSGVMGHILGRRASTLESKPFAPNKQVCVGACAW